MTADQVEKYISDKLDNSEGVQVNLLKTSYRKKCYLVGIPKTYKEKVYAVNFWLAGVGYARFNFNIGGKLLRKTQEELNSQLTKSQDFLENSSRQIQ